MTFMPVTPDSPIAAIPGIGNIQVPSGLPAGVRAPGNILQRMSAGLAGGLTRAGGALFQAPAGMEGMDPAMLAQLRQQAMLQLGLGMMAANERGAGLGGSVLAGLQNAQSGFQDILQQSYRNTLLNREQSRAEQRDERDERRWQSDRQYQLDRDRQGDDRWRAEQELRQRATEAEIRANQVMTNQRGQEAAAAAEVRRRIQELTSKPELTEAERLELEILTGGSPSNMIRAQSGLGMFGMPGMFPGMGMPPGMGAQADPLSMLPDPPEARQTNGASGAW